MEFEKRNSKGSFLQLFDWNVKSRKKLFSNKSELSENSKHGKENFNDSTTTQLQQVHENGCGQSTSAPGVVARLMGLDSLPTSNVPEPCCTPFFDSLSFRESHYSRGVSGFQSEDHIVIYDSMRNKLDGFTRNPVELMLQKVQSRPIERFHNEVLPPKSAKPISITHHRLLSPIKSPGFIPTMNAAYLMEAAAKIIEQSPRSITAHKVPSLGSSSGPLRIQDLREKAEAAQKSSRILETSRKAKAQNPTKYNKGQPSDRVQGRPEAPVLLRASGSSKNATSEGLKNKDKAVSLATQAKSNVQKRDGLTSVANWNSANQKECNKVKHGSVGRNQQKVQRNVEKRTSMSRHFDVLRQNNQKQNSASKKERDSWRPPLSHQKERKPLSANDFRRPSKTVNRIVVNTVNVSRKSTSLGSDARKEQPSSMMNKSSRKKQSNGSSLSDGSNNASLSQDERSVNCNFENERYTKRDAADLKNGMDVVSFTFTSPIKKSVPESASSGPVQEKKRSSLIIPNSCNNQSSFQLDDSHSNTLSMLLEQKLKELTSRVESSPQDLVHSGFLCSSADTVRDSAPSVNMLNPKLVEHGKKSQIDLLADKPGFQHQSDYYSVNETLVKEMQKWQGSEEVEEHGSINRSGYERELYFQHCRTASSLEPSYSAGNCTSSNGSRSISSEGSKNCVSVEVLGMMDWSFTRNSEQAEADVDLSDSASSTSFATTSVTDISSTFASLIVKSSSHWEFEYIGCILVNTNFMFEEFALGQAHKIISPNLFDQLEEEKPGSNQNVEENLKLERKLLFDYVGESLELRCMQLFGGSMKHWAKLKTLSQRKEWLTEELYREISGWTSMEGLMVDELVDKDMSTQLGKWVDFETEAFEEGVEIEKGILTYLVDELIDEFFFPWKFFTTGNTN